MSTSYFIFKKNLRTGKTVLVSCGSHDTEEQCSEHFHWYMYGFMDGAFELAASFELVKGSHDPSFILVLNGEKRAEYFMLTGMEGAEFHMKIIREQLTSEAHA